jgi:Cu(I)/Ag(I) efflux system membrane fusion protein
MALEQALLRQGLIRAIPESAVIDTGREKIVYVESGPGMFDGMEVQVGPKCGVFYPLLKGLELDQRVATAGAFLIDAESRLNPAAASLYFGSGLVPQEPAGPTAATTSPPASEEAKIQAARAQLDLEERRMVEAQEFCPVLEKNRLGAMGKPFKILIHDQAVFLCCEGCREEAASDPDKTLAKIEKLKRQNRAKEKGSAKGNR